MARIDICNGMLSVGLESHEDVAQLRVGLKCADGADEVSGFKPNDVVPLDPENPFNFIALEATDFQWSLEALMVALECLTPIARSTLSIHTKSSDRLMKRRFKDIPDHPGLPGEEA